MTISCNQAQLAVTLLYENARTGCSGADGAQLQVQDRSDPSVQGWQSCSSSSSYLFDVVLLFVFFSNSDSVLFRISRVYFILFFKVLRLIHIYIF